MNSLLPRERTRMAPNRENGTVAGTESPITRERTRAISEI